MRAIVACSTPVGNVAEWNKRLSAHFVVERVPEAAQRSRRMMLDGAGTAQSSEASDSSASVSARVR
jgi:hypothetical protein